MLKLFSRYLLTGLLALSVGFPALAGTTPPVNQGRLTAIGGQLAPAAYTGQVATRTHIPDQSNAGVASLMSRRADFARANITTMRLVFANFYNSTSAEVASGGVATITASVEYPQGTFTQVLFSGVAAGSMTDGQAQLVSDPVSVAIPDGAQFWTNTRYANAAGIIFSSSNLGNAGLGDQYKLGSNVADNTMVLYSAWSGGTTGTGGTLYGPSAIIATTTKPAVALVGDSRVNGTGATAVTGRAYSGELAPQLAPYYGVIDLSRGSQTAQQLATGQFVKRLTYLQYATHAVLEMGYNDLTATRTAAQILADRQTIRALAPNLKWFGTTVAPGSTSTDSWATLTNQTTVASNAERILLNERVRATETGFVGFYDTADAVESARNSGIWRAPPMVPAAITGDGVHANDNGYGMHRGFVEPMRIVR